MLSIALKSTDRVDLIKPCSNYCSENFGRESLDALRQLIENINATRAEVTAINGRGNVEAGIAVLGRYLSLCVIMEQRFQFGDTKGTVQVRFKWADSFNTANKASLCSILFEKACVLYNIAALHTHIAVGIDRTTPGGVKDALKQYQQAAGIFVLLRDEVASAIIGTTTADLNEHALSMSVNMCMAQAQTCIYEKAVRDKLNRSLLSKLACQIAQYHNAAISCAIAIQSEIGSRWLNWNRIKEMAFLSASHFHRSLSEKEEVVKKSEGYGVLIARLKVADALCKAAIKMAKDCEITVNMSMLDKGVEQELKSLSNDNDLVYLERIPEAETLAKLEVTSAVAITPVKLDELYKKNEAALVSFDRLVPANIRKKADEYNSKCEGIIADVQRKLDDTVNRVSTFNSVARLPFSANSRHEGLPETLWENIHTLQLQGGGQQIESTMKEIQNLVEYCEGKLESITKALEEEARYDNERRERYTAEWKRPPSSEINSNFWESIDVYRQKMKQAITANHSVEDKIMRSKKHLSILAKTRDEITEMLPCNVEDSQTSEIKERQLEMYNKIQSGINNAKGQIDALKDQIHSSRSDLIGALMQARVSGGASFDTIVGTEVNKMDPCIDVFQQSLNATENLLTNMKGCWESQTTSPNERAMKLKEIEESSERLNMAMEQATQGLAFFTNLQEHLKSLSRHVEDWVFARNEEGRDSLQAIQRKLQNMSF